MVKTVPNGYPYYPSQDGGRDSRFWVMSQKARLRYDEE
ncbi:hypothetical protein MC7420_6169 [Coleofasciculus chthonoplastes PCC 7420]|uniref:Uncharacterized protein n=1 Tax=Coleofasciculus chthonoplastes PCC 7420 TaxID=118168 RepID=B4VTV8_9CYAN|nr:hypothetical protein MC7420_6169 [Coleofasciculus chthonoplastes PCC 7420]